MSEDALAKAFPNLYRDLKISYTTYANWTTAPMTSRPDFGGTHIGTLLEARIRIKGDRLGNVLSHVGTFCGKHWIQRGDLCEISRVEKR
jgi:hypothetical protein